MTNPQTTIILALCLLLAACDKPLTNEEIVKRTDYCREHNMGASVVYGVFSKIGAAVDIQCDPIPRCTE